VSGHDVCRMSVDTRGREWTRRMIWWNRRHVGRSSEPANPCNDAWVGHSTRTVDRSDRRMKTTTGSFRLVSPILPGGHCAALRLLLPDARCRDSLVFGRSDRIRPPLLVQLHVPQPHEAMCRPSALSRLGGTARWSRVESRGEQSTRGVASGPSPIASLTIGSSCSHPSLALHMTDDGRGVT
jgi:hypothetical protein